jgi:F-box and WD-40 domain protein 1/11
MSLSPTNVAGPSRLPHTTQSFPSRKQTDSTLRHLEIPSYELTPPTPNTPTRNSFDSWTSAATPTPGTPPFNRLLGSVLGSPYLTTLDATADNISELDLIDGAPIAVPHAETVTRPPSPAPTSDFSLLSAPTSPVLYPRPDAFDMVANDVFSLYAGTAQQRPRRLDLPTSSSRLGLGLGGLRRSPVKARGILPRLLEALAASSPSRKGKARTMSGRYDSVYIPEGMSYADLEPLDGEEGELVDEACFVPCAPAPRVVTGMDVLASLPVEVALYTLSFLDSRALIACSAVSHTWRALALDNVLWQDLFAAMECLGWRIDLGRLPTLQGIRTMGTPKLERRASERGMLAAMARERRNSERSVRSQMSTIRPSAAARPTLDAMSEEQTLPVLSSAPVGPHGLDWHVLYKTHAELDRRWLKAEPGVTKISGHADRLAIRSPFKISCFTDFSLYSVYCLEFDSTRILTGSRDRTIKAWDLATGRLLGTFWGHAGSVLCLKFDGDWERNGDGGPGTMVSGSSDCSVLVWQLSLFGAHGSSEVRADVRGVLKGHGGGVLDLRMDTEVIVSWCVPILTAVRRVGG